MIYVREPEKENRDARAKAPLTFADAKRLSLPYWFIVVLGAVFTLARFSEAFLVLRAQDVGLELGYVPVVMIVMNVFYAAAAYPAGAAADSAGQRTPLPGGKSAEAPGGHPMTQRRLLLLGLALLIAADLVLALAASPPVVFAGAALVGLAHGFYPGIAVEACRRNRARRSARHGFRDI